MSIPGDQIIVAKRNVEIHDKKLLGDLVILDAKDFFYLILDIDWFSQY